MVQAVQEGPATGDDDALLHDVGRELGWCRVERDLDRVDDCRHWFLDRFAYLFGRDDDRLRQPGDEVAAADLRVELLFQRVRARERDLDLLRGSLTERERVFLLDVRDDRVVELVARDPDGFARDDAAQRDDRNLGRAATHIDDHVAGGLMYGEPGADRGGHRLLDDVGGLAGAGVLGRFLHGALLDTGNSGRHANHHPGLRPATRVHLLDEVAQHLLADVEVRDDAVLERPDRLDVTRGAADHPLRFRADRKRAPVLHVDRDDGRLVEDDAATPYVDQGVGRPEVDGHVTADDRGVPGFGHGGKPPGAGRRGQA